MTLEPFANYVVLGMALSYVPLALVFAYCGQWGKCLYFLGAAILTAGVYISEG